MNDPAGRLKTRSQKIRAYVFTALVGLLIGLLFLPSPIDPVAYQPMPTPPMTGATEPNQLLGTAELLAVGQAPGPEDVDVDAQGRIYGATEDGRIVRLGPDGEAVETFAETGGRPLGLEFDADGDLIVADAIRGLLSVDPEGTVTVLSTGADGVPFGFADDLDIASDGTIYFSDASHKFGPDAYLYDLLEARPNGRLLAYDPATGETRVLLDELYFANGIALSRDESFLLVNETYRYRILRYWLRGEKAGTSEVFIENLPGFPDGVSGNRRGTFWVAMFTVRNGILDRIHPWPLAKSLLSKLPKALWPKPEPYGFVLALNEQGKMVASLQDPGGEHIKEITSAEQHGEYLYLGSLTENRIGRILIPEELRGPEPEALAAPEAPQEGAEAENAAGPEDGDTTPGETP